MTMRRTKPRLMRWLVGAAVAVAVVAGLSFVSGCANAPTGPVEQDQGVSALQFVDQNYGDQVGAVSDSAHAKLLANLLHDLTSLLIGPDGGLLSVDLGDKSCTLQVPEGAVTSTVRIDMSVLQVRTPWADATVLGFGPDGLVFASPATLTLETNRANGSTMRLFWWNPDTSAWEFQQATTVSSGRVSFQIRHFSKYGIS